MGSEMGFQTRFGFAIHPVQHALLFWQHCSDCFCLLCCVICCFGGIKPPRGGFITPKGVVLTRGVVLFPKRGGCIPPKGWFYPPKGVVLPPLKVGIKPPGVVLRVVLSPIWGWFYARAHSQVFRKFLRYSVEGFVTNCCPLFQQTTLFLMLVWGKGQSLI